MTVVAAIKLQYVEEIDSGYESIAVFAYACAPNGEASAESLFETAKNKMFPNGIAKAIVNGYDYMVLTAFIEGREVLLFPGTVIILYSDGNFGVLCTNGAAPTVNIEGGSLVLS